jgi:pyridoxal phosphate enzyme (YggS family)
MSEEVRDRIDSIRERISRACTRSGRDSREVILVGACKRQPTDRILAARAEGLAHFGENQVQEAMAHSAVIPSGVEWHLIGPLQSNKANKAVRLFRWIHSIDRQKIARAVDRAAAREGKLVHGLLEINLAAEPTKHGFVPEKLASQVKEMAGLEHLRIEGLMAIPPFPEVAEESRPWFRQLREVRDELFGRPEWTGRPGYLSMGMSADFEIAIEEGTTHVRIGTLLFGPRPHK